MTEEEWLAASDPRPMLEFLRGLATDRKLRLFAVACCRRNWHLLNKDISQPGVQVIERYADGLANDQDLKDVHQAAWRLGKEFERKKMQRPSPEADLNYRDSQQAYLVAYAAQREDNYLGMVMIYTTQCKLRAEMGYIPKLTAKIDQEWFKRVSLDNVELAKLIRDVFGNPFRPATFDPRWRTSDVVDLAHGIYEAKAFERMPILADAFMDAGCEDEQIIGHCRGDGPHVRGCWVVDLVLGKE